MFSLVDPGWRVGSLQDKTVIVDVDGQLRHFRQEPVAEVGASQVGASQVGPSCLQPSSSGSFQVNPSPGIDE